MTTSVSRLQVAESAGLVWPGLYRLASGARVITLYKVTTGDGSRLSDSFITRCSGPGSNQLWKTYFNEIPMEMFVMFNSFVCSSRRNSLSAAHTLCSYQGYYGGPWTTLNTPYVVQRFPYYPWLDSLLKSATLKVVLRPPYYPSLDPLLKSSVLWVVQRSSYYPWPDNFLH